MGRKVNKPISKFLRKKGTVHHYNMEERGSEAAIVNAGEARGEEIGERFGAEPRLEGGCEMRDGASWGGGAEQRGCSAGEGTPESNRTA